MLFRRLSLTFGTFALFATLAAPSTYASGGKGDGGGGQKPPAPQVSCARW
jgi:hypothetical protein